ncbi:MAG: PKD domain-containing protein [Saprospiraceae bacterium]|nr:PKD domain-containing protein [Saprospiraceae bacterium]
MKKHSALCLWALLLPFFALAQPCTYLAYEAFDTPANSALNSQTGGAGWSEPWLVQNGDLILPGYQTGSGAAPLAFGALQTLGRYATGGRVYLTAGRRLDTNPDGPFRDFISDTDNAIGTQTGTTLWLSALLRKENNNNQSVFAGLHDSQAPWCLDCTAQEVSFGYFEGHSEVLGQRRWTLRLGDAYYPSAVAVAPGVAAFLVVKIQFNAGHTAVDFFVNPGALGNTSPSPTLSQTSTSPFSFRSLAAYLGDSPGNGAIDEIRLANSYACVAPDNTVSVNLPPVAQIAASATEGQIPLSVNFSAAASFDPEGSPLHYRWNFGDGSPEATGATLNHTFADLGKLTVRLTVQDAAGLEHTAFQVLTLRDANQSFPCQSSFSLLRQAACNGQGGVLRVNDPPAMFSLRTAGGIALAPTNGTTFQALAAGQYTYLASGADGCRDSFVLQVPVDSTTCPGWQAALCDLAIGTNLSGFADWVPERPLRNLMKHVRPDFIAFDDACFCWSNGHAAELAVDADGYPTHIPQTVGGVANKVRFMLSSEGANLPPGHTYVLLYSGTGSLTVQGGAVETSKTPGRIQFEVTAAENLFFRVDVSQAGDPVRNVRVLRLEDEFADLAAQPFYPGFLEKIEPFAALRFMDWGATNGNPVVHWSERTALSRFTYAGPAGVPYELMIQLANQTQKDVWICVPHAADSAYVAQMAALFRDQLNPGLRIYLEYSNEVWNWIFAQAHYNTATAPSNLNYGRAMAAKAGRTFRIWHEVFGAQKTRVKRVLGLQAGFNYLNEQILSQLSPEDWDLGSPTSYIGLNHEATGQPVLNAASTPQDILANARHNWHTFIPALRQDYNNIKLFGKPIVNYEGGQHFVGNVFGIGYPYQQAMYDAQYAPEIYALYDDMLDTIRNWGSRLFGNFSLASPQESIYGSWGVLNDIDVAPPFFSTAPKYQALLDNLCPQAPSPTGEAPAPENRLRVFPNPSSGQCWVDIRSASAVATECRVFNLLGGLVQRMPLALQAGDNRFALELSGVPAGVYRVVVPGVGERALVLGR